MQEHLCYTRYCRGGACMAQTTLTIRIDEDVKAQFLEVCDAMGIPATTALTIFIRRVIRDREIPFILSADSKPTNSDK